MGRLSLHDASYQTILSLLLDAGWFVIHLQRAVGDYYLHMTPTITVQGRPFIMPHLRYSRSLAAPTPTIQYICVTLNLQKGLSGVILSYNS